MYVYGVRGRISYIGYAESFSINIASCLNKENFARHLFCEALLYWSNTKKSYCLKFLNGILDYEMRFSEIGHFVKKRLPLNFNKIHRHALWKGSNSCAFVEKTVYEMKWYTPDHTIHSAMEADSEIGCLKSFYAINFWKSLLPKNSVDGAVRKIRRFIENHARVFVYKG